MHGTGRNPPHHPAGGSNCEFASVLSDRRYGTRSSDSVDPCVESGFHARGKTRVHTAYPFFFVAQYNEVSFDMTTIHSLEVVEQTLRDIVAGFTLGDWNTNVCCSEYDIDRITLIANRVQFYPESAD